MCFCALLKFTSNSLYLTHIHSIQPTHNCVVLQLTSKTIVQDDRSRSKRRQPFFEATPKDTKFQASSFASLNLSRPLVKACTELGYSNPTPIQVSTFSLCHLQCSLSLRARRFAM